MNTFRCNCSHPVYPLHQHHDTAGMKDTEGIMTDSHNMSSLPQSETTPPPARWSCRMPRLSEIVSGWHHTNEQRVSVDSGGGDAGIAPSRRKMVRTRTAPAGPHPYLDRFASGMHKPLEGGLGRCSVPSMSLTSALMEKGGGHGARVACACASTPRVLCHMNCLRFVSFAHVSTMA